jgi:uncharacterized membrane protein
MSPTPPSSRPVPMSGSHLRHHLPYLELFRPFGAGKFGEKAEAFARFFGTPRFLIGQTAIVGVWILLNSLRLVQFDLYPFILLNLAFSLQTTYAAPLILLAQTRQADRERGHAEADALHREELARAALDRQEIALKQSEKLGELLEANTELTEQVQRIAERIDRLTQEIHGKVVAR